MYCIVRWGWMDRMVCFTALCCCCCCCCPLASLQQIYISFSSHFVQHEIGNKYVHNKRWVLEYRARHSCSQHLRVELNSVNCMAKKKRRVLKCINKFASDNEYLEFIINYICVCVRFFQILDERFVSNRVPLLFSFIRCVWTATTTTGLRKYSANREINYTSTRQLLLGHTMSVSSVSLAWREQKKKRENV